MIDLALLIIDGGTTHTRFTLTAEEKVLARFSVAVGAADADTCHQNPSLRAAVRDNINMMEQRYGVKVAHICLSGMITSENGLYHLPHISAPAGIHELAMGARTVLLDDVFKTVPTLCVPGIRTGSADGLDMMRGEETELMGDLTRHGNTKKCLYIHFGSHNKAILMEQGRIVSSRTTISGELLMAVTKDTILSSSIGNAVDFRMDEEYARRGYASAGQNGITRALFGARLCAVLYGASPSEVRSYIYGALAQQDVLAFRPLFKSGVEEVVLYGRKEFSDTFQSCAKDEFSDAEIRIIPFEDSEWLSVRGMQFILAYREQKGAVL